MQCKEIVSPPENILFGPGAHPCSFPRGKKRSWHEADHLCVILKKN